MTNDEVVGGAVFKICNLRFQKGDLFFLLRGRGKRCRRCVLPPQSKEGAVGEDTRMNAE